jgi:hypothetical protein
VDIKVNVRQLFRWISLGCFAFIVMTTVAMVIYPGGTWRDPTTRGYRFFYNFFSDLGMTVAHNGMSNTPALLLFVLALTLSGAGLALFFVLIPYFFWHDNWGKLLAGAGSVLGVIAGLSFIGIALTPANLLKDAHILMVNTAFRTFPVAVGFYVLAILREPSYPNHFLWGFGVLGGLLVLYLVLLTQGPSLEEAGGMVIQAVGQKIIVYASLLGIAAQLLAASSLLQDAPVPLGTPGGDSLGGD